MNMLQKKVIAVSQVHLSGPVTFEKMRKVRIIHLSGPVTFEKRRKVGIRK